MRKPWSTAIGPTRPSQNRRGRLGSGAGCTLDLAFTPVITGPRSGSLTITSNAATSPDAINLTGVGTAPSLLVAKQATPDTIVAHHGEVTYTVALLNILGTADAVGAILTDTLPFSTTFARWVDNQSGAILHDNQITWQGTATAGQYISFTFVATHTGRYREQVTNVAIYTHSSGGGSAQTTFIVEPYHVYLPGVLKVQPMW